MLAGMESGWKCTGKRGAPVAAKDTLRLVAVGVGCWSMLRLSWLEGVLGLELPPKSALKAVRRGPAITATSKTGASVLISARAAAAAGTLKGRACEVSGGSDSPVRRSEAIAGGWNSL